MIFLAERSCGCKSKTFQPGYEYKTAFLGLFFPFLTAMLSISNSLFAPDLATKFDVWNMG